MPPELHDAPGEQVGVPALFVRVLQKLARHGEPRNAAHRRAHDLVEAVAQHTHQLRREGVVEQLQHQPPVAFVPIGDGAVVELRAGARARVRMASRSSAKTLVGLVGMKAARCVGRLLKVQNEGG